MCLKTTTQNNFHNCSCKDLCLFKLSLIYINTLIHVYVEIKIKSHIILIMIHCFFSCNRRYIYVEKNIILIMKLLKNILIA